ncbi:SDR family oxidoreductase [Glycocaulis sp.]|uniref:SDR family NAD(P)-dependent oxidoreductase n=1 Tax=Glycocaulis sp. TaxID=1969725 RepID=UPI0025C5FCF7|nr:SDR family oxidoreductase [Glycocaulis sp.]MCH8522423.1 SDR family oxidoreductase [Glycocaulis sp.]
MGGRLNGKLAFVTGGSRGIGAAICRAFAAEGAHVVLTYGGSKDKAEALAAEINKAGGKAEAIGCDASVMGETARVMREVAGKHGPIDVLVNNAGIAREVTLAKLSDEDWNKVMAVNVTAPFEAIRLAGELMNPGGSIISIGSILGDRAPAPGLGAYCASKAAVQLLTKAAARELGRKGLRANVIQPGPIDTDMNPADGETADLQRMMVPLGRYGKAEEIGTVAVFLASDESSYVNGTTIDVAGGMTA